MISNKKNRIKETHKNFDFNEANENLNMAAFGLDYAISLCERCKNWKSCAFSDDYTTYDDRDSIAVVTSCNFYEEEEI